MWSPGRQGSVYAKMDGWPRPPEFPMVEFSTFKDRIEAILASSRSILKQFLSLGAVLDIATKFRDQTYILFRKSSGYPKIVGS